MTAVSATVAALTYAAESQYRFALWSFPAVRQTVSVTAPHIMGI